MYGMELSERVRRFQETGEGWDDLKDRIALFIYRWGLRKRNLGEDRSADFLLSFLPRIASLVKNYRDYDCPFEHYVKVCLEWHMVKFHTCRDREEKKEELFWQTEGKEDLVCLTRKGPPYGSENRRGIPLPSPLNERRFRKHFLTYLLYHVDDISHGMIPPMARFLNMSEDALHRLLSEAESLIRGKQEKREAILEKKRSYFIDHCYQEMRLSITEDEGRRGEIKERMELLKHRMEQLKLRIERIKMTPSTEEVGRLTGKSSSSVGRDISTVREYLGRVMEEDY